MLLRIEFDQLYFTNTKFDHYTIALLIVVLGIGQKDLNLLIKNYFSDEYALEKADESDKKDSKEENVEEEFEVNRKRELDYLAFHFYLPKSFTTIKKIQTFQVGKNL